MNDNQTPDTSRRSVLKTAAWTVPAITLAAAAPAFATSDAPGPVCEIAGWRTNHGHKDYGKPESGTHHYHVTVACASTVRAVWIAGVEATLSDGVWTALNIRGGVRQWVSVLTDDGTLPDREIRFQPTDPR